MPTIKISDLHPTGSELFSDSESFMNDLVDGEIGAIQGGFSSLRCVVWSARFSVVSVVAASIIVSTARAAN